MEYSSAPYDEPIGLQKLNALDNIEVHATLTWSGNKYEVREGSGEHLFDVKEEPRGIFSLNWAFTMALTDLNGVEVISVHRKSVISVCKLEISIQGALVSRVQQKKTCLKPIYEIFDANEVPVYRLKGPCDISRSYQFDLTTMDKTPVGVFSREWGGWCNELTSNRDYLNISFPQSLDTKYKAACIAASIHIIDARRRRHR